MVEKVWKDKMKFNKALSVIVIMICSDSNKDYYGKQFIAWVYTATHNYYYSLPHNWFNWFLHLYFIYLLKWKCNQLIIWFSYTYPLVRILVFRIPKVSLPLCWSSSRLEGCSSLISTSFEFSILKSLFSCFIVTFSDSSCWCCCFWYNCCCWSCCCCCCWYCCCCNCKKFYF